MKCPNCNAEVTGRFCSYCGSEMPKEKETVNITDNRSTVINNYYTQAAPTTSAPVQRSVPVIPVYSKKSKAAALILYDRDASMHSTHFKRCVMCLDLLEHPLSIEE